MAEASASGVQRRVIWSPTRAAMRALAVMLATLSLGWAAAINGQPFIHPDTVGYTRGPDVAVMKLLGSRFATVWARTNEKSAATEAANLRAGALAKAAGDNQVLAGRSIYYGVLSYLGALTGGFWLTVLVQGFAVALLVEIALRGLRMFSLAAYAGVMALLTLATPAPMFVGFIMPDIWAGIAIGALAALFALSRRLTKLDVAALGLMVAFAGLAHNSVVPVIGAMTAAGGGLWLMRRSDARTPIPGVAVGAAALVIALAGGVAFNAMVKHTVGKPPVTPPFLTARVIADGPGLRYLHDRCAPAASASQPFAVCRYADRLPLDVDHFLWGATSRDGVFQTVSSDQQRALGDEQTRFALSAVRAYPLQQAQASLKNAILQTFDTDLSDFNYKPSLRESFAASLPAAPFAVMQATTAFHQAWPLGDLWGLQTGVVSASLLVIGWSLVRPLKAGGARLEAADALILALLIVFGVIANGVVCGVLSTLYGRYQARVIWLAPMAAVLLTLARSRAQMGSVRPR